MTKLRTNGGASYTPITSGTPESGPLTVVSTTPFSAGFFQIGNASFGTNAPHTGGTAAFNTTTQLGATNTDGTVASITFAVVDNAFTSPTSGTLENTVNITSNMGTAGNSALQNACAISGAATVTAATVGGLCSGAAPGTTVGGTTSANTASATTAGGTNSYPGNTTPVPVASLTTPFTVAEFFTLTLQPNSSANADGTATVRGAARVTEPVSLSLLAVGLIGLGAAGMRRKA